MQFLPEIMPSFIVMPFSKGDIRSQFPQICGSPPSVAAVGGRTLREFRYFPVTGDSFLSRKERLFEKAALAEGELSDASSLFVSS